MAPRAIIVKRNGEQETFENAIVQKEGDSYFIFRVDEDGNETEEVIEEYPEPEIQRAYDVPG
jgi:hypothetical protein